MKSEKSKYKKKRGKKIQTENFWAYSMNEPKLDFITNVYLLRIQFVNVWFSEFSVGKSLRLDFIF